MSAGDSLQQKIITWLSPPDPSENHHIACESRHPGSALWFIQSNTFSEWKVSEDPSCLLWVHGKRSLMPIFCVYVETEVYLFIKSGRGKKRFLVCQISGIPGLGTYRVGQLHNH